MKFVSKLLKKAEDEPDEEYAASGRVDDYHTRCSTCREVKENFLFAPGALRKGSPRCRKCTQEAKKRLNPPGDMSRHWRNNNPYDKETMHQRENAWGGVQVYRGGTS
jgi:hypothetical protein